jgi:hypothetical protein
MKNLALTGLLAGALLATACNQQKSADGGTGAETSLANVKDINQLFELYWEDNAKLFPLDATTQGDNRYNDQLPNDATKAFTSMA